MVVTKKKDPESIKDRVMVGANLLGGLLIIITVLPGVPWRTAEANKMLTSRFSGARAYSLSTVGNNYGEGVSWFKMRGDVCKKVQELTKSSPVSTLVGAAAAVASDKVGTGGGAAVGCASWPACKDHAAQRCSAYATLATAGILCLLLNVAGAIGAFACPALKWMEAQGNKKKKQLDQAKFNTMVSTIVAFLCPFFAVTTWVVLSDSTFKSLKETAFFPYPPAAAGPYLAGVGTAVLAAGMFCGITRLYPLPMFKSKEPEPEQPEEYAAGDSVPAEAAALMPGMGLGWNVGPPGMGPPMPPPVA